MARISELIRKISVTAARGKWILRSIVLNSNQGGGARYPFRSGEGNEERWARFYRSAVAAGAVAVICSRIPEDVSGDVRWIVTGDPAEALGIVASEFYGNPSSSLKLTGVTGTNGKTTTATLLYRMFSELGYKCGLFSTEQLYNRKGTSCNSHNTRSVGT